jgi:hypothetical protein
LIEETLEAAQNEIYALLKNTNIELNDAGRRTILKRYDAAIRPNLIVLIAAAGISPIEHPLAKYATAAVLYHEIRARQNQPMASPLMLLEFVSQVDCIGCREDTLHTQQEVTSLHAVAGELNPTRNLMMNATLQYALIAIYPFLRDIAQELGATDFSYIDVCGSAASGHAQLYTDAVLGEIECADTFTENTIGDVVSGVLDLFKKIF